MDPVTFIKEIFLSSQYLVQYAQHVFRPLRNIIFKLIEVNETCTC
jgi:hypothetical protein